MANAKHYVDPAEHGTDRAEAIALQLHREKPANAQYSICVGPKALTTTDLLGEDLEATLRARELAIAETIPGAKKPGTDASASTSN